MSQSRLNYKFFQIHSLQRRYLLLCELRRVPQVSWKRLNLGSAFLSVPGSVCPSSAEDAPRRSGRSMVSNLHPQSIYVAEWATENAAVLVTLNLVKSSCERTHQGLTKVKHYLFPTCFLKSKSCCHARG